MSSFTFPLVVNTVKSSLINVWGSMQWPCSIKNFITSLTLSIQNRRGQLVPGLVGHQWHGKHVPGDESTKLEVFLPGPYFATSLATALPFP